MEPDKFEKHIKDKLGERKLEPSPKAWNAISNQLGEPEHKNSTRFYWYAIAASFIGILIVVSIYLENQKSPIKTDVEVVEIPKEENKLEEKESVPENVEVQENQVATSKAVRLKEKKRIIPEKTDLSNSDVRIASVEPNRTNTEYVREKASAEELIDDKIAQLVAHVDLLESQNRFVSDTEVDSLLRKAQRDILTNKVFNKEGKVDAMALLNEVESELDQTFREQIFESLKSGFQKVRTAVADRNN